MENKSQKKISEVKILGEEKIEISDCKQIVSSTDREVIARSESGFVSVFGSNLTIAKLIPEGGLLSISGNIGGIKFDNKVSKKSFLKKVFK